MKKSSSRFGSLNGISSEHSSLGAGYNLFQVSRYDAIITMITIIVTKTLIIIMVIVMMMMMMIVIGPTGVQIME